jgi:hypothetical protein
MDGINQVFFSWSHDGPGLAIFAHSFADPVDAKRWQHRLNPHLRLQPMAGHELPKTALSYLAFDDGYAAVLRRVDTGYSTGRNNSHALIGPVDVLSAPVALGLGQWSGWWDRAAEPRMSWYRAADFGQFAEEAEHLQEQALMIEPKIRTVFTRLFDEPNAPLSVIGCPDAHRLALIWGLRLAAEEHLGSAGVRRLWTFSTYENRHDVSADHLPEIVFLPANPAGASTVQRTIIDLQQAESVRTGQNNANRLLDVTSRGATERIPSPAEHLAKEPEETQEVQQPAQPKPPQGNPSIELASAAQVANTHQTGQKHPAKALAMAKTVHEFDAMLSQLEALAQFPENRKVTRDALTASTLNSITSLAEDKARQELYVRLLKAVYGQKLEDLQSPEAIQHAANVIQCSQSEVLARLVGQAGETVGSGQIAEAGRVRWVAGGQQMAPAPGRWFDNVRPPRRFRLTPLLLVTVLAIVAVLVAVFLFGVQAGGPDSDAAAAPPTEPSVSTSSVPPSTSVAPAPIVVPASAFEVVDDPQQTASKWVVAFLQSGAVYYPQALCAKGNGTWQCMTNAQQAASDITADAIALAVPTKELPELVRKAVNRTEAQPTDGWSDPLPHRH